MEGALASVCTCAEVILVPVPCTAEDRLGTQAKIAQPLAHLAAIGEAPASDFIAEARAKGERSRLLQLAMAEGERILSTHSVVQGLRSQVTALADTVEAQQTILAENRMQLCARLAESERRSTRLEAELAAARAAAQDASPREDFLVDRLVSAETELERARARQRAAEDAEAAARERERVLLERLRQVERRLADADAAISAAHEAVDREAARAEALWRQPRTGHARGIGAHGGEAAPTKLREDLAAAPSGGSARAQNDGIVSLAPA